LPAEKEKIENLQKQLENFLSKLPENYPQRFERMEKLLYDFTSFLTNWLYISVQVDRKKYEELIGKEKFEELKSAIAEFMTQISMLKEQTP
jgi:DNA-binding ferritin-like protein (Dps family)